MANAILGDKIVGHNNKGISNNLIFSFEKLENYFLCIFCLINDCISKNEIDILNFRFSCALYQGGHTDPINFLIQL